MKQFILLFGIALLFLACKDAPEPIKPKLKQIWKEQMQPNITLGVVSQPAITYKDMVIYSTALGDFNMHVYARDFKTGKLVWEYTSERLDVNGKDALKLFGEVVVLCTDKDVFGIDANTGKQLWDVEVVNKTNDTYRFSSTLAPSLNPNQCYVADHCLEFWRPTTGRIYQINTLTGKSKILLTLDIVNNYAPNVESQHEYLNSQGDTCLFFQNRTVNAKSIKNRVSVLAYNLKSKNYDWRVDSLTPTGNSARAMANSNKDNIYFIGDYSVYCLDKKDGKIVWENGNPDRENDNNFHAKVFLMDNMLLHKPNITSVTYAWDQATGKPIWRTLNTSRGEWNPIREGDTIYFNTDTEGNIYALRLSDGAILWQYPEVGNDPAYMSKGMMAYNAKEKMFVTFDGVYVYGFKLEE